MKRTIAIIAALLVSAASFAQTFTGGVKATVVSRAGRAPIAGALVQLSRNGAVVETVRTGQDGFFQIEGLENGMYDMNVTAVDFVDINVFVTVDQGFMKDLIFVSMTPSERVRTVDTDNVTEFDLEDSGYNDAPTVLFGGDVYSNVAGYGFSSIRFKNRGYNSETQDVYLAGVKLNDAITGYSPYSLWSGINEATRSKESTIGLEASDAGVGGVNGITNILGNASSVRPGWRFSLLTNSALYRLRLMGSYASGKLDNGWSYAFNFSARVGGNDWTQGVFYRNFSYYAGVDKTWGDNTLSLFTFAATGSRGAQNASTQEVYNLMGDNMYNSNWGYQDGKMRNSRVRKVFEPVTVLRYSTKVSSELSAEATLLWRTGSNGYTALDWYDAADPRPDYYRNLPSYYRNYDEDFDPVTNRIIDQNWTNQKADYATEMWTNRASEYLNYQHLNWDRLYNVNYNSEGGRSKYALEERHVDQNDLHLNLAAHFLASSALKVDGGLRLRMNRTENYKKINDLLGGQYYLNVDSFAERDYASSEAKIQNDLDYWMANGSSEKITEGGKYGYDYLAQIRDAQLWANAVYTNGSLKASLGGTVGYNVIWREGLMRKGLFAGAAEDGSDIVIGGVNLTQASAGETSKGKSEVSSFLTYSAKGKLQYSLGGGHIIYANAGYFADAPTFNNSFISPRTRNTLVDGLTTKKTLSADINYALFSERFNYRITAFYTTITDQTSVRSFYDDTQHSFTNFAMTGIDERHMGVELGFKVPTFVKNLSLTGVLSYGEYVYTGTPRMKQTIDNSAEVVRNDKVTYWSTNPVYKKEVQDGVVVYETDLHDNYIIDHYQKHYVSGTPQLAGQLGFNYNINYWFIDFNGQYFGKSYLEMNPLYRTIFACKGPDDTATPSEIEYMTSQEAFDPSIILNVSIGKSWYINRHYNFGFSLNANNILNNRSVKTGGYEQTRLATGADKTRYYKFDSKYFYMPGANYMLNLYFRF